jgi:hypothetical protein
LNKIAKVTRVSSLYSFLSKKFLPYYCHLIKQSQYQSFESSLLTPRRSSSMTLPPNQDICELENGRNLNKEIEKLLDKQLLQECYENLKGKQNIPNETTSDTQIGNDFSF